VIFRLRRYTVPNPIPSLRGARIREKPVVPLKVIGPTGTHIPHGLVDSGADDVVFGFDIAALIGIDLSQAPQLHAVGVGAVQPAALLYAPVILELADGNETCRWRATVAFTPGRLRLPLLGIAGGLEYFRTILAFARNEVILEPEPTLPATQDAVP
jgi:hypothetical protein